MARVNSAEHSVFGYNQTKAKQAANVNKDIISATQAIQASVADASNNRTTYVASGLALVVIGALAYQNYIQTIQLGKLSEIFEQTKSGTNFNPPMYDGGPSNEACLDILLPKMTKAAHLLFGQKYSNFVDIINNQDETQTIATLSSFVHNTKLKTPNGDMVTLPSTTKLGALITTGCDITLTNFEKHYKNLEKSVLFDALQRAADVANYDQWTKLMIAYEPHIKEADDYPYGYALRATDALDSSNANIQVNVQVGDDTYNVFNSNGKLAIEGYLNPRASILKGLFQNQIINEEQFPSFIEMQMKEYFERGDHERLDNFLNKFPGTNEKPIFEAVQEKLRLEQDDDGSYFIEESDQPKVEDDGSSSAKLLLIPSEDD